MAPGCKQIVLVRLELVILLVSLARSLTGQDSETVFVEGFFLLDRLTDELIIVMSDGLLFVLNFIFEFGCGELVLILERLIPN